MPIMPRLPGKAKKIAWNIIGKPAPLRKHRRSKQDNRDMVDKSY